MQNAPHVGAQLRYRKLLESLPDSLVFILDSQLCLVEAGGSLVPKLREPRAPLAGQPLRAVLSPTAFAAAEPHLRAALQGEAASFELVDSGGETYDVRTTPLPQEDGSIFHILVLALATTTRKQALAAERTTQGWLRQAVHAANVGLWDWDLATNRVYYSPEWKYQLGCADQEIGDTLGEWEQRVHPEDLPHAVALSQAYIAAPWPNFEQEFRMRHKDGTYRWILAQGTLHHNPDGTPGHFVGSHIDVTQQKQAAAAQAASIRLAQATLDSLSAQIAIVDSEGTILAVNRAWRDFYTANRPQTTAHPTGDAGQLAVAYEGASYAAVCRAAAAGGCAEAQMWLDGVARVLAGEVELAAFEYPCHSPDELRWFVTRITRMAGDGAVRLVVAHENITRRVLMEQALRSSEARYRSIFENNHSVMLVIDPQDGRIVDANPAAAAFYGWSCAKLRTMNIYSIDTGSLPDIQAEMACAEQEQRHYFRLEHRLAGGELRDVEVYSGPIELDGVTLAYLLVHDVTERRQAEAALRRSEAALKRSQAVAHVGHWSWDTRTNTVTWSDEMKRIFGLDPATFAGSLDEVIAHAIHPDDAARVRALNAEALHNQQPAPAEYRVVWPDGSIHHVLTTPADRTLDVEGRILQLAGVVQDITERKQAEALQIQLQRQERLAAVGQLAAGIAHDFNNILSVITIYAELTSEVPALTEKERARPLTIIDQAMRANRMIRQILDFSRQSVLERQPLDLLPVLKEQEKLLKQTLPESIEVMLNCRSGEYFVLADPTRMQQLVMNLAVNARDAMPQGGSLAISMSHFVLTMHAARPAPEMQVGRWVRLDVADTGVGMPPEVMAHIFEPFFTTKEPGKGTGLGLAQAHGIVAQHEGHITVTSEVGAGTVFSVFLPAYQVASATAGEDAARTSPETGCGEKILVVEDDAILRGSLADLLEQWRYQVAQAANGEEALAYLDGPQAQVDLILSDVVMPRLGGLALLKTLRQRRITTPMILMSGHPLGEERLNLADVDALAWLEKPPNSQELARALRAAFVAQA